MFREHIDTSPVWQAFREDSECPLCELRRKVEEQNVTYFLGESVMEPDQRIEVNQKGFCPRHFRMMYDAGNRLGLGLVTHTHLKEVLRQMKAEGEKLTADGARKGGGIRLFGRGGTSETSNAAIEHLQRICDGCVMCERLGKSMERYVYTLIYMYRHESEFPKTLQDSKGFCLKHYIALLRQAPNQLNGETLTSFTNTLVELQNRNFERLEQEIEWFTKKFDYQNEDKPWGNSRDAVKRSVNKLRESTVE